MSIDEAIRALEKKWRKAGDVLETTEYPADADLLRQCADELAALLTTRQEVAPVESGHWNADEIMEATAALRGQASTGQTSQDVAPVAWTDDRGLERLREGKQEMVSGVRLGSDTIPLYTSTGQTSDARDGISLIAAERRRQVEAEGWSAQHDDEHDDGELAAAATCYVYAASLDSNHRQNFIPPRNPPLSWPWEDQWFKPAKGDAPADRIRDLMKAGALIAAEIDRLQRAAMQEVGKS